MMMKTNLQDNILEMLSLLSGYNVYVSPYLYPRKEMVLRIKCRSKKKRLRKKFFKDMRNYYEVIEDPIYFNKTTNSITCSKENAEKLKALSNQL